MKATQEETQQATRHYEYVNGNYTRLTRQVNAEPFLNANQYMHLSSEGAAFRTYQQTASANHQAYAVLVPLQNDRQVLIFFQNLAMYLDWCRRFGCAVAVLDQLLPDR